MLLNCLLFIGRLILGCLTIISSLYILFTTYSIVEYMILLFFFGGGNDESEE